jgi:heme/copper-type cytochrome/quinol oxidase subunit 2
LCGLAHYRMKATYVIESAEQYAAWLASEAALLQP